VNANLPGKNALTKPVIDLSHFVMIRYHPGIRSKELHDLYSPNTIHVIDSEAVRWENLKERYHLGRPTWEENIKMDL